VVIETSVDPGLEHNTYGQVLERLHGYTDPAVHVHTMDGYLQDPALVSGWGSPIAFVDLSLTENPDSTIIITAGRHAPEYGGAEAAVELIDKVLASPGMREYLEHGEITIVPAVHVDAYGLPPDQRPAMYIPEPGVYLDKEDFARFDADRNDSHDTYRFDPATPTYQCELNYYEQLFEDPELDPNGMAWRRTFPLMTREAFAVARLVEEKKANRESVLFAADLHETPREDFTYTTVVYEPELVLVAEDAAKRVGEKYPTQPSLLHDDRCTFTGFCNTLDIDAYTTEGSPFDGSRHRSMAERVEQQLLFLDALFEHYLEKE